MFSGYEVVVRQTLRNNDVFYVSELEKSSDYNTTRDRLLLQYGYISTSRSHTHN